jgi:hypothetical protein
MHCLKLSKWKNYLIGLKLTIVQSTYNKKCKTCNTIICIYIFFSYIYIYIYIYKHKRVITIIYYKYISTIVDTVNYVR